MFKSPTEQGEEMFPVDNYQLLCQSCYGFLSNRVLQLFSWKITVSDYLSFQNNQQKWSLKWDNSFEKQDWKPETPGKNYDQYSLSGLTLTRNQTQQEWPGIPYRDPVLYCLIMARPKKWTHEDLRPDFSFHHYQAKRKIYIYMLWLVQLFFFFLWPLH